MMHAIGVSSRGLIRIKTNGFGKVKKKPCNLMIAGLFL